MSVKFDDFLQEQLNDPEFRKEYESNVDELFTEQEIADDTAEWVSSHQDGFTPGGNPIRFCSKCGWVFGAHMIFPDYNYCPNCGRRIEREEIKCDQE